MKSRGRLFLICAIAILVVPVVACGDVLYEGQGWRISGPGGSISVTEEIWPDSGFLVINIDKVFSVPPDPLFGTLSPLIMTFEQIAPDVETTPTIVIDSEMITNGTGEAWNGFDWTLVQFGYASFDELLTLVPGQPEDSFNLAPFNDSEWLYNQPSPNMATWSQTLHAFDGIVPDGEGFSPGVPFGGLFINVDMGFDGSDADAIFYFKEIPTLPEPTSMAILALGGFSLLGKRRRAV